MAEESGDAVPLRLVEYELSAIREVTRARRDAVMLLPSRRSREATLFSRRFILRFMRHDLLYYAHAFDSAHAPPFAHRCCRVMPIFVTPAAASVALLERFTISIRAQRSGPSPAAQRQRAIGCRWRGVRAHSFPRE